MNEMEAWVVRLEGADAWVQATGPGPACGACSQKTGCAGSDKGALLSDAASKARQGVLLRLPNAIRARPGDAVLVRAADGMVIKAVWRAYGIPLVLGLLGAALGFGLAGDDMAALLGLLAGLLAGVVLLRLRGLEASSGEPILSMCFKPTSIVNFKDREIC
jgi:positive regulator of sigma E activity